MSSSHLKILRYLPPLLLLFPFSLFRETFTPKECGNSTCGTSSGTQLFRWKASRASMMSLGMKSLRSSKSMSVVLPGTHHWHPLFFCCSRFGFAQFFSLCVFCLVFKRKVMLNMAWPLLFFHVSKCWVSILFGGSSSFVLILFGANHLPTLLRTFARIIRKTRHPLLICSWLVGKKSTVFLFVFFFRWWNMTCFFIGLQISYWTIHSTCVPLGRRLAMMGLCTFQWKQKAVNMNFLPLRIMGSQNWWFGDPKEPYVIAESNPFIGRVQWFLG